MVGLKSLLVAFSVSILVISCTKVVDSGDLAGEPDYGGIIGVGMGPGQGGDSTLEAGKITAGEWNDLSNWGFWEDLLGKPDYAQFPIYWEYNTQSRISVVVKNEQGFVIIDEPLKLLDANG